MWPCRKVSATQFGECYRGIATDIGDGGRVTNNKAATVEMSVERAERGFAKLLPASDHSAVKRQRQQITSAELHSVPPVKRRI